MSGFNVNPFSDPFADPSITEATNRQSNGRIDEYNPFANQTTKPTNFRSQMVASGEEPAVINTSSYTPNKSTPSQASQPSQPPPSYMESNQNQMADDLRRKQEELERKAAELAAREEALRNAPYVIRENNFPPLPKICPCTPCFYQDINVEIPVEFQKMVRIVYHLWLYYIGVLFINLFGGLASWIVGVDGGSGIFAFSLVAVAIFTPLSYVCWFRPLYKAFKSDSSFNFMVFFFVFFCQLVFSIVWALGIPGMGSVGLVMAIKASGGHNIFYVIFIFICAIFLASFAVLAFLVLVKVHSIYRSTGASLQKAQAEFAQGVLHNEHVQQAATAAATGAARHAMNQTFAANNSSNNASGFRY